RSSAATARIGLARPGFADGVDAGAEFWEQLAQLVAALEVVLLNAAGLDQAVQLTADEGLEEDAARFGGEQIGLGQLALEGGEIIGAAVALGVLALADGGGAVDQAHLDGDLAGG